MEKKAHQQTIDECERLRQAVNDNSIQDTQLFTMMDNVIEAASDDVLDTVLAENELLKLSRGEQEVSIAANTSSAVPREISVLPFKRQTKAAASRAALPKRQKSQRIERMMAKEEHTMPKGKAARK